MTHKNPEGTTIAVGKFLVTVRWADEAEVSEWANTMLNRIADLQELIDHQRELCAAVDRVREEVVHSSWVGKAGTIATLSALYDAWSISVRELEQKRDAFEEAVEILTTILERPF